MLSAQQVAAMVLTAFHHHTEGEAEFTYPLEEQGEERVYAVRAESVRLPDGSPGPTVAVVSLQGREVARFGVEVTVRPL